jgi:hypothetical protein
MATGEDEIGMTTKERPILFAGEMVNAILAKRKTQTRRIIKPQPSAYVPATVAPQQVRGEKPKHEKPYFDAYNGGPHWCWWDEYDRQGADWIKCPYGKPGERLWVRENSAYAEAENGDELRVYQADAAIADVYQLDCGPKELNGFRDERWEDRNGRLKWTPSIHMPRWASRITLEITAVRVERLNDISEADAMAEGCERLEYGPFTIGGQPVHPYTSTYAESFRQLWGKINGPETWEANPLVWAISFKVVA